jgi:hypothetical protein
MPVVIYPALEQASRRKGLEIATMAGNQSTRIPIKESAICHTPALPGGREFTFTWFFHMTRAFFMSGSMNRENWR